VPQFFCCLFCAGNIVEVDKSTCGRRLFAALPQGFLLTRSEARDRPPDEITPCPAFGATAVERIKKKRRSCGASLKISPVRDDKITKLGPQRS
jgi:hypothetical protein